MVPVEMPKLTVKKIVSTSYYYVIGRSEFIQLCENSGLFPNGVPENPIIYFRVPSGGDYSGDPVDLEDASPSEETSKIVLRWVEEETE